MAGGTNVVIRLPADDGLFGPALADHPGSRLTAVRSGQHDHDGQQIADHLALVEGLPDSVVAGILLAWGHRCGEQPQALGGPFALRLPVARDVHLPFALAMMLQLGDSFPQACFRIDARGVEVWTAWPTEERAFEAATKLGRRFVAIDDVTVATGEPRVEDVECWALLRMAAHDVVPDCLVAA